MSCLDVAGGLSEGYSIDNCTDEYQIGHDHIGKSYPPHDGSSARRKLKEKIEEGELGGNFGEGGSGATDHWIIDVSQRRYAQFAPNASMNFL